jgi:hypothetical protein
MRTISDFFPGETGVFGDEKVAFIVRFKGVSDIADTHEDPWCRG